MNRHLFICLVLLCLANYSNLKAVRKRYVFGPGSFNRGAVEQLPPEARLESIAPYKNAAFRDMESSGSDYGYRRLPLRTAVETVPSKEETESLRIPLRDSVEKRPPAYDDDLFALTDELESLGIDPWAQQSPPSLPDKYQNKQEPEIQPHHYVIEMPNDERKKFSQLDEKDQLKYYGAALSFNQEALWKPQFYAAYQPVQSVPVNHFRIDNAYQQLIALPSNQEQQYYGGFQGRNFQERREDTKRVVCFIEGWSAHRRSPFAFSPASLPPVCTHVIYAFISLDPHDFTLTPNDREYDVVQGGYRMVTGLKRFQPGLKVLISVDGDRSSGSRRMSQMVASSRFRKDFIESAVSFCKQHGFDGVDLHWRYPGNEDEGGSLSDKDNLAILLKEMNDRFDKDDLIITMGVPAIRYKIDDGFDINAINKQVEFVTLNAFDLHEDQDGCSIADHHSALLPRRSLSMKNDKFYTVDYAVRYWLRNGLNREKLVLGVPLFGRSFTLENPQNSLPGSRATGPGLEGAYTGTKGLLSYFEICENIESGGWSLERDESGSPYIVKGDQWIGYDDENSIKNKMAYARELGLGGGAIWAADMDDFRGLCGNPWPLLTAMSNAIKDLPNVPTAEGARMLGSCQDNELVSDPTNCAKFYLCHNNQKYHLACHSGMLFDTEIGMCRSMEETSCIPGESKKGNYVSSYSNSLSIGQDQQYYQTRQMSQGKRMVCFMTNWAFYRKGDGKFVPEHIDTRLCTHIVYAYASLDPEKLITKEFDTWADIENNLYSRVTSLGDVKVLLGLGGWTDSAGDKYSKLVSSGAARRTFVTNLVAFLRKNRFQGIHLDWNYPKCWQSNCAKGPDSDKPNFAKLIQEISEEFKKQSPPMELGVAISGYKEVLERAYDLPALGKYADFLSVMSYDYHGGWEPEVSHGSPLYARQGDKYQQYSADYAIKYILGNGAPADKLLLGLAFYGQTFQLKDASAGQKLPGSAADGPGIPGDLTQQPGMLAYYEICNRVKSMRWKTGRQDGAGPYAYNGDQWVGYEDADSVTQKVSYAMKNGLGGVVAWTIDLDDFSNTCCDEPFPLLRAAGRALGRQTPAKPVGCERPLPPVTPAPPITTTIFDSGSGQTTVSWSESTTTNSPTTTSPWWTTTTSKPPIAVTNPTTTTPWWATTTTQAPRPSTTTSTTSTPWWATTTQATRPSTTTSTTTTPWWATTTTQAPRPSTTTSTTTTPWWATTTQATRPSSTATTPWWATTTQATRPSTMASTPWWATTTQATRPSTMASTPWWATTTTPGPISIATEGPCVAGSYTSDPSNCGSYYLCIGNEKRKMDCAPGLHWNSAAGLCDWPASAKCQSETMTTRRPALSKPITSRPIYDAELIKPQSCINGAYYPGQMCSQFAICVNNVFVYQDCAPGLGWNSDLNYCDIITRVKCAVTDFRQKMTAAPLKSSCIDGSYSPYPNDCQKYQQCQFGQYQARECNFGLHWNRFKNVCDWPNNAGCNENENEIDVGEIPDSVVVTTRPTTSNPWTTTSNPWTTTSRPTTSNPWTTTSSPWTTTSRPTTSNPWTTTSRPWTTTSRPWTTQSSQTTSTTQGSVFQPSSAKYKIVCYFTNWAWYRRGIGKYVPEDIDANLCTHIVYGFAVLDYENLVIKAHDSWADFDNKFYERVVAYRNKGLKVTLALGGWNDSAGDKYSRLVNNPAARKRFVEHAVAFLVKYGFDGLDLDWEYPKCWQTDCTKGPDSDKAAFSKFVNEISVAFKPRGLLLSAAVSASKKIIDEGYDVASLARDMDWIAVMTYDFHGQWDKKTGHIAPLYYHPDDDVVYFNANYSMHYWIDQGAPPEKLVMGMPLYGQSFTLGTSWDTPPSLIANKDGTGLNVPARAGGQAGEYTRAPGFLAYYEICDKIRKEGWKVEQDEYGRMGPHAFKGDQWVGFDDTNMIRKKSQFVKSLNLGGAMVWALDLDDFKNSCGEGRHPLLSAIKDELYGSGSPNLLEQAPISVPPSTESPKPPKPQKPPVIEAVEAEEEQPSEQDILNESEGGYKMVCYFTNWAWYRQGQGKYLPSDIDPSLCSHIVYGFAVLDTQNLIIKPHDSWADIDNKFYEKVTSLRKRGIKVLLALGGWNDSAGDKYSRLVNNPSARRRFVIHALDFVTANNFDGLDLDWEYPVCWQVECPKGPPSDKEGFSALVKELRQAFGPKNLLLSAAVSPNRKVIDAGYDVPALSENLDWIAVMTYDYHGQWDKITGHIAPMYAHPDDADKFFNANSSIHHWIAKGAARSKLVMGLPLYGQSFSLASNDNNGLNAPTYGGGEAGDFTRARGFLSYYEICDRIKNKQWKVVRDPKGRMGPYAFKADQWVSFDDIAMIKHKTSYMKAMGLGGGMIWALDLDDFRGSCGCEPYTLLKVAARGLDRIKSPQPPCALDSPVSQEIPTVAPVFTQRPTIVTQQPFIPTQKPIIGQPSPILPSLPSQIGQACSGLFAPDPTNCQGYYLCNQGKYISQLCPNGLHWNVDRCDWPASANCKVSGSLITTTSPIIPPVTQVPENIFTTQGTTPRPPPPINTVAPSPIPSGYKMVCYFTNWAWYRQGDGKYLPEDIDPNLCTHVAYGFAVLDAQNLVIIPHDSWADIDNDFYGKVTSLRSKGIKVLIAIGGWNDSLGGKYSKLVNDPNARAKFIANVLEFIEKWRFDGLDLDWEYPKCWQTDCNAGPASDKTAFATFVRELKTAFKPRGLLLTAAVSASKAVIDDAYDVPSIAENLDFISLMTYDFHGSWDKKTGHVAPLYYYPGDTYDYFNTNYTVNYWIKKGAHPSKLILGIPLYGQSFTLVDSSQRDLNAVSSGPGEAGEFTRAPGFLAYYEICSRVKHSGWSVGRDPENRVGPWARRGSQWVSFDDTKMAARKAELVRQYNLGGAMVWALDLDDFRNKCGCGKYPLLNAIKSGLQQKSPSACDL